MRRLLLVAALAALLAAPLARAWTWPTDGSVLQPFSFDSNQPYAGGQHRGLDVAGDPGAPVRAPAAGEVTYVGTVPSSGRSLTITTADGYAVTLTHLGSTSVTKGSSVAEGDVVGTIGPTGDPEVGAPYVHLGIRLASDAQGYVDPATLLPARLVAPPPAPDPAPAAPPADPAPVVAVGDPPPADPAPPTPPTPAPAPAPAPVSSPPVEPAPDPAPAPPAPVAAAAAPGPEPEAAPPAAAPAAPVAAEPGLVEQATPAAVATTTEAPAAPIDVLRPAPAPSIHAGTGPRPRSGRLSAAPVPAVPAPEPAAAPELRPDVFVRALQPTKRHPRTAHRRRADSFPGVATSRSLAPVAVRGPRAAPAAVPSSRGAAWVVALAAVLGLTIVGAGMAAVAWVTRRRVPTMVAHAVLRDDTHLLRQRPPAHRSRLHDDRGGHPRAPSPAARRRDVLPHRRRRARDEGLARR